MLVGLRTSDDPHVMSLADIILPLLSACPRLLLVGCPAPTWPDEPDDLIHEVPHKVLVQQDVGHCRTDGRTAVRADVQLADVVIARGTQYDEVALPVLTAGLDDDVL